MIVDAPAPHLPILPPNNLHGHMLFSTRFWFRMLGQVWGDGGGFGPRQERRIDRDITGREQQVAMVQCRQRSQINVREG